MTALARLWSIIRCVFAWLGAQLSRIPIFHADFWAVCEDSVRGKVNPDEWVRVWAKGLTVSGGTFLVNLNRLVHDPDFQTAILEPVAAGLVAGLIEYRARKSHGVQTTLPPLPPTAPPPPPSPTTLTDSAEPWRPQ